MTQRNVSFRKPIRSWLQRFAQVHMWGMDIHPTAKIAPSASIDRTWPRGIHIGADTLICEEAGVLTHDIVRGIYLDTRIGARCYIGLRAIILPGVTIGDDCVVMPGTLVTRDLSPNSIAVGSPARISSRPLQAPVTASPKPVGTAETVGEPVK